MVRRLCVKTHDELESPLKKSFINSGGSLFFLLFFVFWLWLKKQKCRNWSVCHDNLSCFQSKLMVREMDIGNGHWKLPISSSRVGFLGRVSACCWLWLPFLGWETVMLKHSPRHSDLISGTFEPLDTNYELQYCSGKLLPPASKGKPSVTVTWWENKITVDVSNEFCLCLWCLRTLRRHFSQNSVRYFVDQSCVIRIRHDCSAAPPGCDYLLDHIHSSWYIVLSVQHAISMMTI